MVLTILATVVVLGVLIFVHELGHFMAAKAVDIEVPRFSIGLGPKMVGFRRGETEYVISWLPLGGYVKMAGMADEEATGKLEGGVAEARAPSERDFEAKPLWARSIVILAGVTMNWVFAFLAFSVLALRMGVQEPIIVDIVPDTPAAEIGLELGDKFLSIDGVTVRNPGQVSMVTEGQAGEEIDVVVEREGERIVFRATPAPVRLYSEFQKDTITVGRLGVSIGGDEAYRTVGAAGAVRQGWNDTVYWTEAILRILKRLVTGRTSVRELGGPIMIGQISGEAARTGFWSLLSFMAIISINLAVLNLLPIPVLDGGHMVFIVVEALRGKAVSIEQRVRWSTAGMVVVMGIMIWAIGNDLLRVFGL